jgi:hypothetical protein
MRLLSEDWGTAETIVICGVGESKGFFKFLFKVKFPLRFRCQY